MEEEKPRHAIGSPGLQKLVETTDMATQDDETVQPSVPAQDVNPTQPDGSMPAWLLPNKVYDILFWIVITVLPALATLVAGIGYGVGWQQTGLAVLIITAVDTFLGGCMGISKLHAKIKAG
ncbi:hypothetical protein OZX73_05285 [Bifidobacterium sp. ESL0775]|uniref:phage holin n=1 Tax=Bifidobacterium sp. ESL0775 TaxID=2983230 RepID=UPI0023F67DBD|nr:phage holin [Bifidobacterium sp. ESL0775]WEV68705.1 hypothetical protein OZX73_05285 [Bifidobacterium sp. ESL0775]